MNKSKIEPRYRDCNWLKASYNEFKSIYKVADLANCSPRTIHEWLIKFNIPRVGRTNYCHSEETKRKIAKSSTGRRPMLGKEHTKQTRTQMSEARKESGNANWKGGKTTTIRLFRRSKEYVAWKKEVIGRAEGKCENCNQCLPLEAHHKISVHKDLSLGLDLKNGTALCHDCHTTADGRKKREQAR